MRPREPRTESDERRPDSESLEIFLQNISVPAPIISFLSLRVLDRRESPIESRQPLDRLWIAYVTEIN